MSTVKPWLSSCLAGVSLFLAAPAQGRCPSPDQVAVTWAQIQQRQPLRVNPQVETLADGYCAQAELLRLMGPGAIVGWKAALTNSITQDRFGVHEPILGAILETTLLTTPAQVSRRFATRPLLEGDLLVVVKDSGIRNATSDLDVLRHLSAVIPFVELPDLMYGADQTVTGAAIAAINTGVRLGVMGEAVPVDVSPEFAAQLANFQVTIQDQTPETIAQGHGADLLGHPLTVVRWLVNAIQAQGYALRSGDVLSLGSITTPLIPQEGQTYHIRYEGLGPDPQTLIVEILPP